MSIEAKKDRGLTFLLDLDGEIQEQGNGFWIKFSVWQVPMSEHIPHGIRYSLSLHDPYGKRLIGFDNAHAVKPRNSRFNYAGHKTAIRPPAPTYQRQRHCLPIQQRIPIAC